MGVTPGESSPRRHLRFPRKSRRTPHHKPPAKVFSQGPYLRRLGIPTTKVELPLPSGIPAAREEARGAPAQQTSKSAQRRSARTDLPHPTGLEFLHVGYRRVIATG